MNENRKVKHLIKICMGSSCFARGNQSNLETLEALLFEYKSDCEVELIGSRCENRCSSGPNIEIDGVLYNKLDHGSLIELVDGLFYSKEIEKNNIKEN